MQQNLPDTLALLTRTPATLDSLLRGLPASWTSASDGDGKWNVAAVLAHLIHCEDADWLPRIDTILRFGDSQPFPPFDREGNFRESAAKPIGTLLDEFTAARTQSLALLRERNLQPADLSRSGLHPTFGLVSLSQLLATWAAHDLTHLHQITRILAGQYRDAVGPWERFLGVLKCAGHGE